MCAGDRLYIQSVCSLCFSLFLSLSLSNTHTPAVYTLTRTRAHTHTRETFANATMEFSLGPAAAVADLAEASLPRPLAGGARVLDLACSTGVYGATIAMRSPSVNVTFLDQANVIPTTRKWVEHFGVASQATFLQGSAFEILPRLPPRSFDLIVVSQFLHHFDPPTNVQIMKNVAVALSERGAVIINDFVRAPGVYTPWKNPQPFQFDFVMLSTTERGGTYSLDQLGEIMEQAGLTIYGSKGLFPLPNTLVVGGPRRS